MELRKIFFDEITKEEALKRFADVNDRSEFYLLHDDLTESLIEETSKIEDAEEPIGVGLTECKIQANKIDAYTQLYQKLEGLKARVINSPLIEFTLTEVMEAINYIEALGF